MLVILAMLLEEGNCSVNPEYYKLEWLKTVADFYAAKY